MQTLESVNEVERYSSLSRAEFGARCRAARAYAGMTLEEVAPQMGITRQALSRRESGEVEIRLGERLAMARTLSAIAGWREEAFVEEAALPLALVQEKPIEKEEPQQRTREVPGIERFGTLSQEDFAARCRSARAYSGLKLEELGKLMGLSGQALSRRETGRVAVSIPDRFVMAKVYCEVTDWPEGAFIDSHWFRFRDEED